MSILKDLANYYLVKKELIKKANPFHAKDGKFASKDNYETVNMDVASDVKNKKMTDKDWEKVKSINMALSDLDIVNLERHGMKVLDDIIKDNLKELDAVMRESKDTKGIEHLKKERAKLVAQLSKK